MNSNSDEKDNNNEPNWKWWHFMLAAPAVAAIAVWQWNEGRISRAVGGFFLAGLCLLVGYGMKPKRKP
jgi:hypothetical protein